MADVQPPVFPYDILKVTVAPKEIMFGVSRMYEEMGFGKRVNPSRRSYEE
jgi:hypothetical protein